MWWNVIQEKGWLFSAGLVQVNTKVTLKSWQMDVVYILLLLKIFYCEVFASGVDSGSWGEGGA